jgi:hypothetical protein
MTNPANADHPRSLHQLLACVKHTFPYLLIKKGARDNDLEWTLNSSVSLVKCKGIGTGETYFRR